MTCPASSSETTRLVALNPAGKSPAIEADQNRELYTLLSHL
jgi:hypothetical protein